MRSLAVVVVDEDLKDPLKMLVQNEQPVEMPRANGPPERLRHPLLPLRSETIPSLRPDHLYPRVISFASSRLDNRKPGMEIDQ